MVVIRLNIHEAKTHLSRYLSRVLKGETILLCRRNEPIAEIRPLKVLPNSKRPIGIDKGVFELGPEFFEPLPEEILRACEGE